jgi:hypothetical protein
LTRPIPGKLPAATGITCVVGRGGKKLRDLRGDDSDRISDDADFLWNNADNISDVADFLWNNGDILGDIADNISDVADNISDSSASLDEIAAFLDEIADILDDVAAFIWNGAGFRPVRPEHNSPGEQFFPENNIFCGKSFPPGFDF